MRPVADRGPSKAPILQHILSSLSALLKRFTIIIIRDHFNAPSNCPFKFKTSTHHQLSEVNVQSHKHRHKLVNIIAARIPKRPKDACKQPEPLLI
jgi:hypothetical protein